MEYAVPIFLVLLIVVVLATAFVLNSRSRTRAHHDAVAADESHGGGPGIGADPTPLGDTAEHAGQQTDSGETIGEQDAAVHGGTGHPVTHYGATVPPERDAGVDPSQPHETSAPAPANADLVPNSEDAMPTDRRPPESERLADRPV